MKPIRRGVLKASQFPTQLKDANGVIRKLKQTGNDRHTVVRYPNANHALRDVATGRAAPIWDDMMAWLRQIQVVPPR